MLTETATLPEGVKLVEVAPPVEPSAYEPDLPITKRLCTFGTLNVLDPSPAPYVVEISANKALYVERETAVPSHNKYPVGTLPEAAEKGIIIPVCTTKAPAESNLVFN